jgi:hypothetical protein
MAKADWQVVKEILERFQGQTNSVKALEIVKVLSRRIRRRRSKRKPQNARDRQEKASNHLIE